MDGHVVELFLDTGAGGPQRMFAGPGNIHSDVHKLYIDPSENTVFDIELNRVIPPLQDLQDDELLQQGNPPNTDWVKYVKIKSGTGSEPSVRVTGVATGISTIPLNSLFIWIIFVTKVYVIE